MLTSCNLKIVLLEAAKDTPVVVVNGARQTGKSTLVTGLFPANDRPNYVPMDDLAVLQNARSAPKPFLQRLLNV